MKYQIRKSEEASVKYVTHPIELDTEDFRNLSIPYTGNTDKEFLEYIWSFKFNGVPEDLSEELTDILEFELFDGPMETIYNSGEDRDNSVLELGEANPNFTKQGGFMIHLTTTQK